MATSNTTPIVIPQPFAAQATSENINVIPNGATGTNKASFQEGFPEITRMPVIENPLPTQKSGLPPTQQDFNGIFNVVSQHNFFSQNGGTYSFNQAVSDAIGGYPKNAVLWYFPENEDPCLVYSLINDNTNNFVDDPTLIDDEHWKKLSFGGSGEIGDIGFAPLGIDESENKRRYLNGQVIIQSQFVAFTNKVKAAIALFPSLATTETNWQAEKTNSKLGQCGKFVVDDTAGTIRLPAVVNAQGLVDLALLGTIVSESLPNITGNLATSQALSLEDVNKDTDGAFSFTRTIGGPTGEGTDTKGIFNFDASRSSSTYQDNAPVQQEAVQYPYYIVVNTGVEEAERPINNYQVNNVYSYGMSQYYKGTMNNNSWLRSQGQWNDGTVYTGMYNWLLEQMNAGINGFKGNIGYAWKSQTADIRFWTAIRNPSVGCAVYGGVGIPFKGTVTAINPDGTLNFYEVSTGVTYENLVYTESENINIEGTAFGNLKFANDYDFVINTTDQTFRLPLVSERVLVEKKVPTDSDTSWYNLYSDGWIEQGGLSGSATVTLLKNFSDTTYTVQSTCLDTGTTNFYASFIQSKSLNSFVAFIPRGSLMWYACGYGEVPTASGYPEMRYLYYYVGDTLQNADLINVARIEEKIVDKADIDASNFNAVGRSLLSGLGMPSNRYIDLTLGASGSTYTAPANGYFTISGRPTANAGYCSLDTNNHEPTYMTTNNSGWYDRGFIPVRKGQVVILRYGNYEIEADMFKFIYAEGEN